MNATIIISAALAMLSVTSSAIESDKYLHYHVKNNFSYNAQNLLQQKELVTEHATIGWSDALYAYLHLFSPTEHTLLP